VPAYCPPPFPVPSVRSRWCRDALPPSFPLSSLPFSPPAPRRPIVASLLFFLLHVMTASVIFRRAQFVLFFLFLSSYSRSLDGKTQSGLFQRPQFDRRPNCPPFPFLLPPIHGGGNGVESIIGSTFFGCFRRCSPSLFFLIRWVPRNASRDTFLSPACRAVSHD